jgi:hypothetical protein
MKQAESAAPDKPSQRQLPWIVFICAFLGAGAGFALSFHPMGLDAFEFSPVSDVSQDEEGRVHVEGFYLASIRVFGVLVFSEKSPKVNLEESPDLIDRWRRYCQLIAGGMTVTGFLVGAGLGLCVQRLTLRRT